jgi:proteic killer suppression protein
LRQLFESGASSLIQKPLHERCLRRLDALNNAKTPQQLNVPGFDFHALKGFKPVRYTVHVNGPWCITFEFNDGDAFAVDLEQYH